MASVASQLIEEVTAHAQSDSLEDAREICADGTYFPNNLRIQEAPQVHTDWNKITRHITHQGMRGSQKGDCKNHCLVGCDIM